MLIESREGNYTQVRIAAFDFLFLTKWYTPKIMRYILAVMANDSSRIVRRHVARSACQSLPLLVSMGEMKTLKDNDTLMIEEDGLNVGKVKESKKSDIDLMIKALRKDREVGKNEAIREFLMPIALYVPFFSVLVWELKMCVGHLMRTAKCAGVYSSSPISSYVAMKRPLRRSQSTSRPLPLQRFLPHSLQ